MSSDPHAPAELQPPHDRRRWQFGFWTLVEVTAGVAVAAVLWAEFEMLGLAASVFLTMAVATAMFMMHAPDVRSGKVRRSWAVAMLLGIPCTFACLMPVVSSARPAARRSQCGNNIRQVALALHDYHTAHGHFPPPYVVGPDGRPWHSWRALILPHLDWQLAAQYDFSQPWDSPANAQLAARGSSCFSCPSSSDPPGTTHYYYVVGGERWPTGSEKVTLAHVNGGDGTRKTVLLVESHTVGANWLEPRDLSLDEALRGINQDVARPGISSPHFGRETLRSGSGGAHVVMFYGNVLYLDASADREGLRALFTIYGDEDVDPFSLQPSENPRPFTWWLLGIAVAFAGLVVYCHRPRRLAAVM